MQRRLMRLGLIATALVLSGGLLAGCGQGEGENAEGGENGDNSNAHGSEAAFSLKKTAKNRNQGRKKNNSRLASHGISEGITAGQANAIVTGTNLKGAFAGVYNPAKYVRALQEKIKANWQIPRDSGTKSGIVKFVVDHTGSVAELAVVKSSGSQDYDTSMLQAVEHAVPLPPLVASAPPRLPVEFSFDYRLSQAEFGVEEWKKEVADLSAQLEKDHNNRLALNGRARAYMRLGNYKKALADYKTIISTNEDDLAAYLNRAKCYLYIDDYKEALKDCEICRRLAPDNPRCYSLTAAAQAGLGHLKDAFESINTALQLAPNQAEIWALKANCDNLAIQHKEAIADASKAIALDPEYGSAYAYRGDAYEALQDYDQALRDYSRNVELDNEESQSYVRRAELFCNQGNFDKAVFDATEAIRLSPQNGEAFYYRAHANDQLGLKAQAQKDLLKAKQLGF